MLQDRVLQGIAFGLLLYLHISTVLIIIVPWYVPFNPDSAEYQRDLVRFILLIVFTNLFILMVYWHYYLSCSTGPGHVPEDWDPGIDTITNVPNLGIDAPLHNTDSSKPHSHDESHAISNAKRYRGRFCKKCRMPKPPRSHHCSVCKRCVLKMDHHCPWIANCVGFYNLGNFMRFVLSVEITSTMYFCICVYRLILYIGTLPSGPSNAWEKVQLMVAVVNTLLLGIVVLTVGAISVQHLYYIAGNKTLIEALEIDNLKRRTNYLRRQRHPQALIFMSRAQFPYDLGLKRNFKVVFGPHIWNLFVPHKPEGDGLEFPLAGGISQRVANAWPPKLDPDGNLVDIGNPDPRAHVYIDSSLDAHATHGPTVRVRSDSEGYIISPIVASTQIQSQ